MCFGVQFFVVQFFVVHYIHSAIVLEIYMYLYIDMTDVYKSQEKNVYLLCIIFIPRMFKIKFDLSNNFA